ncbi:sensor histidine kinase [Streptomyces armeniacus]|uniref:histidine kinase n=1 Tax=Streptomyces armeniacus TaxID=83291 RepID=A0A345XL41_9ACTN|nr:sensor histidine kinase [Streptomyces armeniacus]AXK32357.1 sensor histidine kinase [Streptomyces armeniacus]
MKEPLLEAWRAFRHLLVGFAISLVCYVTIPLFILCTVMALTLIGAGSWPEAVLALRRLAGFARVRAGERLGAEVVPKHYLPLSGSLTERVRTASSDPGTWRDMLWVVTQVLYGIVLLCVALLLWPIGLLVDGVWCGLLRQRPLLLPLFGSLADLEAYWTAALLRPSPSARLAERVEQLSMTRAGAVAAHSAELRRIERDLHDGAQARLVALTMRLGLARRAYVNDPEAGRALLDDAQQQAEEALAELRHVVRGIHPPVLTDRGLTGAVRALAASHPLRVTVEDPGVGAAPRATAAVEAAAYFVVAEALTNAAKHSGGTSVAVVLDRTVPSVLRIRAEDDGKGGAEENRGSGLLGMRRRVAALDGTVALSSPVGGPTVIEVELPCEW